MVLHWLHHVSLNSVPLVSGQFPVHQPLSDHPGNDILHLRDRVGLAVVVLACELAHVAVKVLRADLVLDALVCPFQGGPEGLHAVCVGHLLDVLAGAVADALVLERHALVGCGFVRVDRGAGGRMIGHEPL